jgi:hypothetical protein
MVAAHSARDCDAAPPAPVAAVIAGRRAGRDGRYALVCRPPRWPQDRPVRKHARSARHARHHTPEHAHRDRARGYAHGPRQQRDERGNTRRQAARVRQLVAHERQRDARRRTRRRSAGHRALQQCRSMERTHDRLAAWRTASRGAAPGHARHATRSRRDVARLVVPAGQLRRHRGHHHGRRERVGQPAGRPTAPHPDRPELRVSRCGAAQHGVGGRDARGAQAVDGRARRRDDDGRVRQDLCDRAEPDIGCVLAHPRALATRAGPP